VSFRRRLLNPFFLVGQGFLGGAAIFFAFSHERGEARTAPPMDTSIQVEAIAEN
jgi:hypothetical protein